MRELALVKKAAQSRRFYWPATLAPKVARRALKSPRLQVFAVWFVMHDMYLWSVRMIDTN